MAALKNRSCSHAENCDFQFTCQVEQYFHLFSISLAKWNRVFPFWMDYIDAVKVGVAPSYSGQNCSICWAAGAIWARAFTQSNGRLSIEKSSALVGGAVHLQAPPGEFGDVV